MGFIPAKQINNIYFFKLMDLLCEHKETGARGIIKEELNSYSPPQYGIFWTENANHSKYANHYYWNDKNKIILK